MSALWLLPFGLLALSFLVIARQGRAKGERAKRLYTALPGVLTVSALVVMQVHANLRGESEIREKVAELSKPRQMATDARSHSIEQSISKSRLNEIVREADRMGPWLLVFASAVLGMSLGRLLDATNPKGASKELDA